MRQFVDVADLLRLKKRYRSVFDTAEGKKVLADLAKVCHAASTTFDNDPHEAARREGKRQVWLRIQSMLNLPDAEVFDLAKEEANG